jgi:hypothetical protein
MGFMSNLFAKIAGKAVAGKLDLKEDKEMGDTKKWYLSKNVWTGVATFLIGAYSLFQASVGPTVGVNLPVIPEWVFAFLGALGIYTRVIADKKIG